MNDREFKEWEAAVFGYGYGNGELYILKALKNFLFLTPTKGNYNYKVLEYSLFPGVFWLLLNTLCHADIIEYGTSPRFGWLTEKGSKLKIYVDQKSVDELYHVMTEEKT